MPLNLAPNPPYASTQELFNAVLEFQRFLGPQKQKSFIAAFQAPALSDKGPRADGVRQALGEVRQTLAKIDVSILLFNDGHDNTARFTDPQMLKQVETLKQLWLEFRKEYMGALTEATCGDAWEQLREIREQPLQILTQRTPKKASRFSFAFFRRFFSLQSHEANIVNTLHTDVAELQKKLQQTDVDVTQDVEKISAQIYRLNALDVHWKAQVERITAIKKNWIAFLNVFHTQQNLREGVPMGTYLRGTNPTMALATMAMDVSVVLGYEKQLNHSQQIGQRRKKVFFVACLVLLVFLGLGKLFSLVFPGAIRLPHIR